ncbi:MAG: FAD-dependent oxidoreductase, partial [bacterium]
MTRDLRALADTQFDLLVVGAGIYGATLAWDAAQRGLSVALIDRGDFGGGTSANSLKTVHGGVRALQSGNASEMRLFVRERRALSRIAPHLVHPLPFVVPTYSGLTRNPVVMRTGFGLYDLVAHDRNDLPDPSKHLPRSRLVSRDDCLALSPHIDPAGVTGGIVWHDCQMYSSDRVLLSFIQSAAEAGAVAANYVEATGWVREAERIIGVQVEDRAGAARFEIRGTLVVNAAGPWSRVLMADLPSTLTAGRPPGLSKAMNLVTRSITTDHAVGGMAGSRF